MQVRTMLDICVICLNCRRPTSSAEVALTVIDLTSICFRVSCPPSHLPLHLLQWQASMRMSNLCLGCRLHARYQWIWCNLCRSWTKPRFTSDQNAARNTHHQSPHRCRGGIHCGSSLGAWSQLRPMGRFCGTRDTDVYASEENMPSKYQPDALCCAEGNYRCPIACGATLSVAGADKQPRQFRRARNCSPPSVWSACSCKRQMGHTTGPRAEAHCWGCVATWLQ
jgi:hypothetical protein